jgi:hypothetical protein
MDIPLVVLFECIILDLIVVAKNIEIPEKRGKTKNKKNNDLNRHF